MQVELFSAVRKLVFRSAVPVLFGNRFAFGSHPGEGERSRGMVVAPVCGRHIGVILGHDQTDGHSMEMMKCKKGRRGRACERLTYATQCSYQKHICAIPLFLQEAQLCGPLVLVRGTAICDLCAFCQRHSCMQPFVQIRGTAIQSSTRGTAMQSLTRGTAMQSLTRGTAMQSLTRGTAMQFLCSDQRRGLARKDAGHLGHAVHMLYSLLCWAPWTCSAYALLPPVLGHLGHAVHALLPPVLGQHSAKESFM